MGYVLEIEGLTKRYGERVALDGLTMAVPPGQVVGLLGPNGSGKTTAMRIVFGVIPADAGTVRYNGEPVGVEQRRRFGYMPEERGLYPDMRVLDQLVYLARLAGVSKRDATARAGALLERLGLADRAGDAVERLSLGNQQRVQLAAALVHEPEALVLDEPFSGLDPLAAASLSEIVQEAARAGRTVLFSSHQLDLVEDLCESVAVLDKGRLLMEGRVSDLKSHSGRRELRVDIDGAAARDRLAAAPGVRVTSSDAGGLRLALAPGVDPLELLDTARAVGRVRDFGLEQPTLAELFLDAVNGHR
jgi:ABC-2 type transport system ATP-binding protein